MVMAVVSQVFAIKPLISHLDCILVKPRTRIAQPVVSWNVMVGELVKTKAKDEDKINIKVSSGFFFSGINCFKQPYQ